jgi:hypothetical protein
MIRDSEAKDYFTINEGPVGPGQASHVDRHQQESIQQQEASPGQAPQGMSTQRDPYDWSQQQQQLFATPGLRPPPRETWRKRALTRLRALVRL